MRLILILALPIGASCAHVPVHDFPMVVPRLPRPQVGPGDAPRVSLAFVEVDDTRDLEPPKGPLPEGISLRADTVRLGPGLHASRSYWFSAKSSDETAGESQARLLAWAERIKADGDRVAIGEVADVERGGCPLVTRGFRTYLVRPAPMLVLSEADVTSAAVLETDFCMTRVLVVLDDKASERLEAVTHDGKGRRIAILVDSKVMTVHWGPIEVPDGRLEIPMGDGDLDFEERRANAQKLVDALNSR